MSKKEEKRGKEVEIGGWGCCGEKNMSTWKGDAAMKDLSKSLEREGVEEKEDTLQ